MDRDDHTAYQRKIVSIDVLSTLIEARRAAASAANRSFTVVHCHGCFDIVHPGHIRYLQFARRQGDLLVVSITGDAAIDKGDQRPYIPEELRAENLAALAFVDYVVIDDKPTAVDLLRAMRPDVYVKGQEYATSRDPRFLAERDVVESHGGRVIFSSGQVVFSSTRLLDVAPPGAELVDQRLDLICRRHGIDAGRLDDLVARWAGLRVVVVGDVRIERYVLCDAGTIASESPMMSLVELDRQDDWGGAAYIAMQAAALGAKVELVTRLAAGDASAPACKALADAGVTVRAVADDAAVSVRSRFLVDDHKLFMVEQGAGRPLDSLREREFCTAILDATREADATILYDDGHELLRPSVFQQLNGRLRRNARFLCAGWGRAPRAMTGVQAFDLLCVSERKLRVAANDFGGGLSSTAYRMLDASEALRLLVTVGKRGLVAFDRPSHDRSDPAWADRLRSEFLPSFADTVRDRLGGGEAVLTASALAMASGASLMQAAYLAGACAALQVGRMGLSTIDPRGLSAWLQARGELRIAAPRAANVSRAALAPQGAAAEVTA